MTISERFCGDLLVDFANAKTSDEAGLNFIANVQKIFGFPLQFIAAAQSKFPQISSFFSALSLTEKEILHLIVNECKLLGLMIERGIFIDDVYDNYNLADYDYGEPRTLVLEYSDPLDHEVVKYKTIKIGKSNKRNYEKIKKLFYILIPESQREKHQKEIDKIIEEFFQSLNEYIKAGDKILEVLHLKKLVTIKRYNQIESMVNYYFSLQDEHNHIDAIKKDIIICFADIIANQTSKSKAVKQLLAIHNQRMSSLTYVTQEGNLAVATPLFKADVFLNRGALSYKVNVFHSSDDTSHRFRGCTTGPCNCAYHEIIAYCLVEFLSRPQNQKYLKKCLICEDYYIAGSAARETHCDKPQCDKDFTKYRKWPQREKDPMTYGPRKTVKEDPAYERLKDYWQNKPVKKSKKKSVP